MLRDGVAHLTLDAAAAEAGLSKGGVLYHFPSRDSLVAGMVDKIIDEFDRDIESRLDPSGRPGSFTRAYIRADHGAGHGHTGARGPTGSGSHRRGGRRTGSTGSAPGAPPAAGSGASNTTGWIRRWPRWSGWPATACGCATCSVWLPPSASGRHSLSRELERLTGDS